MPGAEDKLEIHETIYRYCRSMDRMDAPLALDCFWPEANLEYSTLYNGSPAGFVEWLWPVHAAMVCHAHRVTNILVDFKSDTEAASESMVHVTLRMEANGELVDLSGHGRYLDRWRKQDGRWRIAGRTYVQDMGTVVPVGSRDVSAILYPGTPGQRAIHGARDLRDPSYDLLPPLEGER
ncbi:MAG: hypothetical protein GC201_11585 [Alphaproteobacteria bacterium]|nr:hypothetical protein [Alphaproteobacteria bacterium]